QLVGVATEKGCDLGLDGLRQQRSRAVAQNLSQRIGKSSWLGELENVSVGHGVSLLQWRSGGVEHPHDTPPYPFMPSPTFAHSSSQTLRIHSHQWAVGDGQKSHDNLGRLNGTADRGLFVNAGGGTHDVGHCQ